MKDLHLEEVWGSEKLPVGKNFDSLVKKSVRKKEESEWRVNMNKKSKLRLYRQLKNRLVLEDYVVELDRAKRTVDNVERRNK